MRKENHGEISYSRCSENRQDHTSCRESLCKDAGDRICQSKTDHRVLQSNRRRADHHRRAKAFAHILHNIPIIIRDEELIVGSSTLAPRGCQTFPEYSFQWLEDELDTVATRTADPFYIAEETKAELREVHKYWKGKTTSELATSYMAPEAILAIDHNIFTPGNYFYNGVGHVTVKYEEVLAIGYEGIIAKAQKKLDECNVGDGDYAKKSRFLEAVIMSCQAVIDYAHRYAELAEQMAYQCQDPTRKQELLQIASNCTHVPAKAPVTSMRRASPSGLYSS